MESLFFRFCFLACITLFGVACSDSVKLTGDEFFIEGEISGVEDGVVINLMRWDESMGKRIASDTLRNGRFRFKEKAESDTDKLSISPRGDDFPPMSLYVWAAPGVKIKIKGNGKMHPLWEVKSSVPYQKEQNLYTEKSRDIIAETARLSIEGNEVFSKMTSKSSKEEDLLYSRIADSLAVIMGSLWLTKVLADVEIMEETKNVSLIWLEKMVSVAYHSNPSNNSKEYYSELRKKAEK